jgi:hypothetical protein
MTQPNSEIVEKGEIIKFDKNKDYDYSGFHFFKNGLKPVRDDITFEEWQHCGDWIKRANGSVHFWLGDWLNFGEKKWGEQYSQAIEETEFEYGTLRNDKYVADKIDLSRRRDNLSFAHHQDVADLKPEEQEKLLDIAEKENMNRSDFRKAKQKFVADSKRLPSKIDDDANLINKSAGEALVKLDDALIDCVITSAPLVTDSNILCEFAETCDLLAKKVKKDSHLYFFTNWKMLEEIKPLVGDYFQIKNVIVWDKMEGSKGDLDGNYSEQYELIIFATTGRRILNGPRPSNIINYPKLATLEYITEKPVGLIERLIAISTNVDEVVCDPYMGVGSTCVAAKKLERKYIGIESDKKLFEIAQRSINEKTN